MCQAINTFNGVMGMANKTIDLYVLCSTRTDDRVNDMPTTIGGTNQEGLNITVFLIAYPKPVMQWVFTSDITNTTIDSTDNTFNVFEHVTSLYKANMKLTDYGNYTVFAFNEIGEMYKKTFMVIPQKQILASSRQDSNVLFAAGIFGLVIGLLSIIFAVSFVVFCRFRQKKKDQMRNT